MKEYKTWYQRVMEAAAEQQSAKNKSFASWENEPATEKQLAYIAEIQEFSTYPLPKFTGTTKGEAAAYINAHTKLAHTSSWAEEHGY